MNRHGHEGIAATDHHPLGAVWESSAHDETRRIRRHALGWILITGAVLGAAVWVQPDARGIGTHTQFGLGRCSFLLTHHIPCPTCGMTTAFAQTVRGHWVAALRAQPAGFVLALACGALLIRGIIALVTGRTLRINWYRVRPGWVLLALGGLLLAGWGYKIMAIRATIG